MSISNVALFDPSHSVPLSRSQSSQGAAPRRPCSPRCRPRTGSDPRSILIVNFGKMGSKALGLRRFEGSPLNYDLTAFQNVSHFPRLSSAQSKSSFRPSWANHRMTPSAARTEGWLPPTLARCCLGTREGPLVLVLCLRGRASRRERFAQPAKEAADRQPRATRRQGKNRTRGIHVMQAHHEEHSCHRSWLPCLGLRHVPIPRLPPSPRGSRPRAPRPRTVRRGWYSASSSIASPFPAFQAVAWHSELQRRAGRRELDFVENCLPVTTEALYAIPKLQIVLGSQWRKLALPHILGGGGDLCDDSSLEIVLSWTPEPFLDGA
jgi:hypothetical protein